MRFALELAALFAIGAAFGVINLIISAVVLALFNAKGDKRFQGILVSGPVRLALEVAIAMLGIYSAGLRWRAARKKKNDRKVDDWVIG
ncbi:MAG: hypothetical protein DCC52_17685 [Chloroflexi bacterium]|nr:MAG: hypothetical protein DCC52_17685 [Chloroflexota bacterium]